MCVCMCVMVGLSPMTYLYRAVDRSSYRQIFSLSILIAYIYAILIIIIIIIIIVIQNNNTIINKLGFTQLLIIITTIYIYIYIL